MNERRPELWLVRHGETEWSLAGRHTGRTDLSLTETGRQQASALGQHLAGRPFSLVLCSPLQRARETCRLAGYAETTTVTDGLLEWDYGIYEGRTTNDIRHEIPDWNIWTHPVPQGESIEQVGSRAEQVIRQAQAAEGDVLLFAHAHVLRVLTACWLGLSPAGGRLFALGTASLSVLGYERDQRVITLWNQRRHLARRGNS